MSLLNSLDQFRDYSAKELHKVNATAKLIEYPPNSVSIA